MPNCVARNLVDIPRSSTSSSATTAIISTIRLLRGRVNLTASRVFPYSFRKVAKYRSVCPDRGRPGNLRLNSRFNNNTDKLLRYKIKSIIPSSCEYSYISFTVVERELILSTLAKFIVSIVRMMTFEPLVNAFLLDSIICHSL